MEPRSDLKSENKLKVNFVLFYFVGLTKFTTIFDTIFDTNTIFYL